MTEEAPPNRWRLAQEAVVSPALALIIFGVSAVVELLSALIGEIESLKPLHARLEFVDTTILYVDSVTLITLVVVGAFIFMVEGIAKADAYYHPRAKTWCTNAHERKQQRLQRQHESNMLKLAQKHELESAEMAHVMRSRINHELAPPPKFAMRKPDWTHVVSINKKVQGPDF